MASIGIFHSGHTNLPLQKMDGGEVIPDADIDELHRDQRQIIRDKVEHGVQAEEFGFDRVTLLEHHFPASASEFGPNPLLTHTSIASQTEDIRFLQMANIITWHDPVRLAEQTAMLDVISEGRLDVGIGRGYQPKENEVLGQYWGGTVQDEEKNRASFEEKFDILKRSWTEDLLSYHGEFHQLPPSYTKWHHETDYEYFESDNVSEYEGGDLIDWAGEIGEDEDVDGTPLEYGSTLRSLFVAPKPLQQPHPQVWQPVTSPRSIQFAAVNGINGYLTSGSPPLVKRILDHYMSAVEEAGWPDHRPDYDGEPFEYGWDQQRRRGMCPLRVVFNTDVADDETIKRFKLGLEHKYAFFGPFGINTVALNVEDVPANFKPTVDLLLDKEVAFMGSSEELVEDLIAFKEKCGFEDFILDVDLGMSGLTAEEMTDQMRVFAEDVMPHLEDEFPTEATDA